MKEITADMIKELRERTGVGMGKCKEALVLAEGDMEKAIDHSSQSGNGRWRQERRPRDERRADSDRRRQAPLSSSLKPMQRPILSRKMIVLNIFSTMSSNKLLRQSQNRSLISSAALFQR